MKILVPVDKSRRDGIVLPYAVRLAKEFGATLCLAHVVAPGILPGGGAREAQAYVLAVSEGLREQGLEPETYVRRGDPAGTIVILAEEIDASMIIMVPRGRSGIGKLVLGSVTDSVLAYSGKPVLLLSEAANGASIDEEARRRAVYLATFIWNRRARGIYTPDQASEQLERLATLGLDRAVLEGTYKAWEDQNVTFGWLDIDFQMETLRAYYPDEVAGDGGGLLVEYPEAKAA
jgi:nucleotide-binding universal stress UspA family protein